jgi:hypothetical protein
MVVVTVRLPPLIEFSSFAFKVFKVYFRIKLVGSRCRCDPYAKHARGLGNCPSTCRPQTEAAVDDDSSTLLLLVPSAC